MDRPQDQSRLYTGKEGKAEQFSSDASARDWSRQPGAAIVGDEWRLDPAVYDEIFQGVDLNSIFGLEGFVPPTIEAPPAAFDTALQTFPLPRSIAPLPSTWHSPESLGSSGTSGSYYDLATTNDGHKVRESSFSKDSPTPSVSLPPGYEGVIPSSTLEPLGFPLPVHSTPPIRSLGPIIPYHSQQIIPPKGAVLSSKQALRKSTLQTLHAERRSRAKRPKREGPLSMESRLKAETMRDVGACWRCRKYKKSCNGDGICDACTIPNFKVWPTELGCRRERLGSLVLFLLPSSMESEIQAFSDPIQKSPSWRQLANRPSSESLLIKQQVPSAWALSIDAVQSTNLFHDDYAKLVSIITAYQRTLPKPIPCLETGCSLIIATSVFYNCFVDTNRNFTKLETMKAVSEVRKHLARCFIQYEKLCLSSKRSDWFPALLGACLLVCSSIIYIDAMIVVQPTLAANIWGSSHERRMGMRQRGYQMLLDYLRASTNGTNPLKLECLSFSNWSNTSQVSSDRAVALEYSSETISGVQTLQGWYTDHKRLMMEGKEMFQKNEYNLANIWPIAGMFLLFDW